MFIIDANNLAGRLGLLKEKGFDRRLIGMIRSYNEKRPRKIFLVFDSADIMGDRLAYGKLTVIYSPRDRHYRNADDVIVELIRQADPAKEEITVVTDDIEVKKKAEESKCFLKGTSEFAAELRDVLAGQEMTDEKNQLDGETMDRITRELLEKWKK